MIYTFGVDYEYRVGIEKNEILRSMAGKFENDSVEYSRKELAAVTLQTAMHYFVIVTDFR
jgi:hypothetical protein